MLFIYGTEKGLSAHWFNVNKDTLANVSQRYRYAWFDYKYYQLSEYPVLQKCYHSRQSIEIVSFFYKVQIAKVSKNTNQLKLVPIKIMEQLLHYLF